MRARATPSCSTTPTTAAATFPTSPSSCRSSPPKGHIRAPLLVGGAGAPERHRRRHAWRLQPGRHRDLAGRPPRAADPPRRGRRAARGPPADAGGQHADSARLPWRSHGDGRRRAARSRKAAAAAREARRREDGRGGRRHPRPLGSARAAHRRGLAGRHLEGRGLPRRRRLRPRGHRDPRHRDEARRRDSQSTSRRATRRRPASSTPPSRTCTARCAWPSPSCSTRRWRRTTAPSVRWRWWRARAPWSGRGRARR